MQWSDSGPIKRKSTLLLHVLIVNEWGRRRGRCWRWNWVNWIWATLWSNYWVIRVPWLASPPFCFFCLRLLAVGRPRNWRHCHPPLFIRRSNIRTFVFILVLHILWKTLFILVLHTFCKENNKNWGMVQWWRHCHPPSTKLAPFFVLCKKLKQVRD